MNKQFNRWKGMGIFVLVLSLAVTSCAVAASQPDGKISAQAIPTPQPTLDLNSVAAMQQQLMDPKLDVASRQSLMEKIDLQKRADADRDVGQRDPASKGGTPRLPQTNQLAAVPQGNSSGIYPGSDGMVKPEEAQVNNYWQGKLGALDVVVLAGSAPGDPTQGLVIVVTSGSTTGQGAYQRILAPDKNGSLRILKAEAGKLQIQAENGAMLTFDLNKLEFTQ